MASENTLRYRRIELQNKLEQILGTNNVYFQPPELMKITQYPAIIYERYDIQAIKADNIVYNVTAKYKVTVVDRIPDSPIVDAMSKAFATIKYNRHYVSEGLVHDSFILYY